MRLLAGALPALFWIVYGTSNVLMDAPPSIGPLTAINVFYLAMLPAVVIAVIEGDRHAWPGFLTYVLFVGWMVAGLIIGNVSADAEPAKHVLIYALLGVTAAQLLIAPAISWRLFAPALIALAVVLSGWTIAHALATGFSYRAGVPINPNLPAALIAPGFMAAAALCFAGGLARGRALLIACAMVSLYACLLLGSRGVLLAVASGAAALVLTMRPAFKDSRGLAAGAVAIIVLAQVPSVPHNAWQATVAMINRMTAPAPDSTTAGAGGATTQPVPGGATAVPGSGSAVSTATTSAQPRPPTIAPVALDSGAAKSTAIARFGEEEAASFNLRRDLWMAAGAYLVSGPVPFLFGGGLGTSQELAHEANPVFRNMHNTVLQVWTDFGLIGVGLFFAFHWGILRALWRRRTAQAAALFAIVIFWLVLGLTVTVTNVHLYWVSLGAAAAAAAVAAAAPDLRRAESHFAFGKNWASYAESLDDAKIARAAADLKRLLGTVDVTGKSFLDIGCGSGVHSLAAIRLGASRLVGVDIDDDSVATTRRTLDRFAPSANASIQRASVFELDPAKLGTFDVVYSWGVLHHTGDMDQAIARASAMVAPGGVLIIALYRQTWVCGLWRIEKRWYTRTSLRMQAAARSIFVGWFRLLTTLIRPIQRWRGRRVPPSFNEYVRNYQERGMDFHHDVHDWLGGYPYESILPDTLGAVMADRGFRRDAEFLTAPGRGRRHGLLGSGCDEYRFVR